MLRGGVAFTERGARQLQAETSLVLAFLVAAMERASRAELAYQRFA
jgi:hypothetical protein